MREKRQDERQRQWPQETQWVEALDDEDAAVRPVVRRDLLDPFEGADEPGKELEQVPASRDRGGHDCGREAVAQQAHHQEREREVEEGERDHAEDRPGGAACGQVHPPPLGRQDDRRVAERDPRREDQGEPEHLLRQQAATPLWLCGEQVQCAAAFLPGDRRNRRGEGDHREDDRNPGEVLDGEEALGRVDGGPASGEPAEELAIRELTEGLPEVRVERDNRRSEGGRRKGDKEDRRCPGPCAAPDHAR